MFQNDESEGSFGGAFTDFCDELIEFNFRDTVSEVESGEIRDTVSDIYCTGG